jgi:hypothetical protein
MKLAALLLLICSVAVCRFVLPNLPYTRFETGLSRLLDHAHNLLSIKQFGFILPGETHPDPAGEIDETAAAPPAARAPAAISKADALVLIEAAAIKHRVAAAFVKSIVQAESNFDSSAISPKGAIGLMQLMPDTARQFGADPAIPEQNIDAGTRYLRVLLIRYQNCRHSLKRVIAAYNAGPGQVDRYRGVPPFRETRAYVVRVLALLRHYGSPARHPAAG